MKHGDTFDHAGIKVVCDETVDKDTGYVLPPHPKRKDYPDHQRFLNACDEWRRHCVRIRFEQTGEGA